MLKFGSPEQLCSNFELLFFLNMFFYFMFRHKMNLSIMSYDPEHRRRCKSDDVCPLRESKKVSIQHCLCLYGKNRTPKKIIIKQVKVK